MYSYLEVMKKIFSLFLGVALLLGVFSPALAQDMESSPSADVQGTSEEVEEIKSVELFWPVVAGKTMGDPLYFLKSAKEKVRGWFISGKAKKADYEMLLATKRVVEAEKLLMDGKEDLAIKTLNKAEASVEKSRNYWTDVENKGDKPDIMINIKNQLSNIEVFLNYFESKNEGSVKEKINGLNKKVVDFIISF